MRKEQFGADVYHQHENGANRRGGLNFGTNRDAMARKIARTWKPGDRVVVTITDAIATKTQRQRAFYFGPLLDAAVGGYQDRGYDCNKEQVRYELESLSPHMKREGLEVGTYYQVGVSALTKLEMSDHIDWCIRFCADNLEVVVEDPQTYLDRLYGRPA